VAEIQTMYRIEPGEIDLPCFPLFGLFNAAMGVTTVLPRMNFSRPATVDPRAPVHQVLNLREFGQRAVSLHLYSHPFDSCEVYSLDKGTYFDAPLYYTSEYGQLNAEEQLL